MTQADKHSNFDMQFKDIIFRWRGPALYVLLLSIVAAITLVAILSKADKSIVLLVIFLLFICFMQTVRLLAAILGYRANNIRQED